ncbi:MAG TPA: amidohydrolase family protein [Chthoniobacterales bacterium]|jgi:imidazolonepropionase-like amidohydrolase|nr:amidohydrolase family protein [Chthoniobacterales bacterium]
MKAITRWGLRLCIIAGIAGSAFASPGSLAISNVTVVDMTGASQPRKATVLIANGTIASVGSPEETRIPEGVVSVDGTGKYLIPGLVDMHMHLSYVTELALPVLLANGVTAVRDMGGDLAEIDRWRDEIGKGTRPGPRIFRAGPVLDGPRPEEGKYRVIVKTPEEGRRAVQDVKARGANFIKVYHFLSRESYFAIADEAKKQGLSFSGHIPNGVAPGEASEAGQRTLEHTTVLLQATISLQKKDGRNSKELTAQAFDALLGPEGAGWFGTMAKNGTWHTPTLVLARSFLLRSELAAAPDERRKYVAPATKELWEKNNPVPQNVSPADMADRKKALGQMYQVVGVMRKAGVQMLAGTDPPTRDVFPGFSLHDELGLLVAAGLTPLEALQSATVNPAKCLGATDRFGTVEKGKAADLVLLEGDPLADIANTKKIAAVVAGENFFARPALDEMLRKAEQGATTK